MKLLVEGGAVKIRCLVSERRRGLHTYPDYETKRSKECCLSS
jgi:hypothetical protein